MAWQNPKTDWVTNPKNPDETDFNRIEGNIAYLIDELDTKLPVGNADPSDVLQGKIFSKTGAIGLTGTMPDRGAVNHSLPINGSYTIPDGYHNGIGKVTQSVPTKGAQTYIPSTVDQTIASGRYLTGNQVIKGDANLVSENIKSGVSIFGTIGSLIEGKKYATGTATAAEITTSSVGITVSGLGFTPSFITLTEPFGYGSSNRYIHVYTADGSSYTVYNYYPSMNTNATICYNPRDKYIYTEETKNTIGAYSYIVAGGFRMVLTIYDWSSNFRNQVYNWIAIE